MNKALTIVIPAFNELTNFKAGCLDQIKNYLEKQHLSWEVIVVDDGSTDGSVIQIKHYLKNKHNWRLIENPHQGKAATITTGVLAAKNPFILFTDFDQATPISEIEKLLPFLDKGYQIVIGSREVKGSQRQKEPFLRHLMGKVFNLLVKLIAVGGIQDTQCGFKLMETKIATELFNTLKVYSPKPEKHAYTGAFDVELLFIANLWKLKIAEVPIHWRHLPTERVNALRDSIRMFIDILRVRLAAISGSYRRL